MGLAKASNKTLTLWAVNATNSVQVIEFQGAYQIKQPENHNTYKDDVINDNFWGHKKAQRNNLFTDSQSQDR